jgi:CubicO group peptidase (beta-lactamase class C family)
VDVKKPAPVPEWRRAGDPRRAITLENLLHMSSGLYSEKAGNRTDLTYFGGTAVTEETVGLPLEAPPGRRWLYANNDTLLAVRALRGAINDDRRYLAYPFTNVLWKVGMTRTTPETDWDGNFILSSQVWTTARDLARLGLLHLNDGVWRGERVLPAGWVRYVTTPAPAQPGGTGPAMARSGGCTDRITASLRGTYAARGNRGSMWSWFPAARSWWCGAASTRSGRAGAVRRRQFTADVLADLQKRPDPRPNRT